MIDKQKITTDVSDLEIERSVAAGEITKQPVEKNAAEPQTSGSSETDEDVEPRLKDIEQVLEQYGLEADELQDIWARFLEELKDLPSKNPIVTVFGAFLLGFLAGRSSKH